MLDFKNVYLYFLSLKELIFKYFREIYFLSNFHNKSLNSQTPSRLFFNPNPYLLEPLIKHKSFLFNISENEAHSFWDKSLKEKDKSNIHNFLWLNLIDRKNDGEIIQKIIKEWIQNFNNYKKDIWKESIIAKRIIAWISNSDFILNKNEKDFEQNFFNSLIRQVNFIKKNLNSNSNNLNRIEFISALILSGLVFKEYYNNYILGLKELKKIITIFFDKDGFPRNRNLESLILFLQYFILIKEWIKSAQENEPEYLNQIIEKNIICLNSFNNSANKIPLFNGSTDKNVSKFLSYLEKLNYKSEKKLEFLGKIQILKNKNTTIYFDVGNPPENHLSSDYQSGPLSFEYFNDSIKIITNCGYGRKISQKFKFISRFTSAQSTLCMDDSSVVKFKRSYLINKTFGSTISNTFKILNLEREEDKEKINVSATHDAYLKKFGYLHKRRILFFKKNSFIEGTDFLMRKGNSVSDTNFSIRFHIYPGISLFETMSGKDVLLQIDKKKSWTFSVKNESVKIEKSLFLGSNKILNNQCIVIYGNTKNHDINIKWEFKKSK